MSVARRFFRLLRELARPVVWLFALIGAALIAFPSGSLGMASAGGERMWPAGRLQVMVAPGVELFPIADAAGESWSLHPRTLEVTTMGGRPADGQDARYWPTDPDGFHSAVAGVAFGTGTTMYDEYLGRPLFGAMEPPANMAIHAVHGVAISLWPLLALAVVAAGVRWRLRVRRAAGDADGAGESRPTTVRRLLRPWILLLAGVGALATLPQVTKLGPGEWIGWVNRGPIDSPHPRIFEMSVYWTSPPPMWLSEGGARQRSAPLAGGWFNHYPIPGRSFGWYGQTAVGISLWWLVALGLAFNAVTLWRTQRRGEPVP